MNRAARLFTLLAIVAVAATAQVTITSTSPLPTGYTTIQYSYNFQANYPVGGVVIWSLAAGALPPGFKLSSNGNLSAIPDATDLGTFTFTIQALDQNFYDSKQFSLTIVAPQISITSASPLPNALDGQGYSFQFTASNNTNIATAWSIDGPAPGLTMSSTGLLSGIPNAAGQYEFTAVAEIGNTNFEDAESFILNEYAGQVVITTKNLPFATLGQAYSGPVQGTPTGITWSQVTTGNPPPGIGFNAQAGTFNGTPTTTGIYSVAVSGAATNYISAQATFPLYVTNGPLSITQKVLPAGTVNQPYQTTLTATGGLAPFTWTATDVLGLTINPSSGLLSGTPNTTGTGTVNVSLTDSTGTVVTSALSITIVSALTITTPSLPDDAINVAYSYQLAAAGGTSPYTWAVTSGTLPAGLKVDAKTGIVSGTPTGPVGLSTFTITVTDSTPGPAPISSPKAFTLNIATLLSITTTSLPNGNIGVAYSQTLAATGGRTPYNWSIGSGALPEGMSIDGPSGTISGTPTAAGPFNIIVVVQDAGGQAARQPLSFTISNSLTFSGPTSITATVGTAVSQAVTAAGGTSPYTFAVTSGTLPAGLSLTPATGAITGTPTAAGDSSVTFTVTDQRKTTATGVVAFAVSLPSTPPVTFTLGSGTQPPVTACLGGSYPVPVTATLTVAFKASSAVATGTDTSIQFATPSTGSPVSFTMPACGSAPPTSAAVTMGTVAGTITVTADLTAGGNEVTPTTLTPQSITIPAGPPVIQSVTLTQANGVVTVTVVGYSSTREVSNGTFQFAASSGNSLTQSSFSVPLSSAFTTWYTTTTSQTFGSQFKLTVPFNVSGSASSITGVTVTLTNTQGNSAPVASQ